MSHEYDLTLFRVDLSHGKRAMISPRHIQAIEEEAEDTVAVFVGTRRFSVGMSYDAFIQYLKDAEAER